MGFNDGPLAGAPIGFPVDQGVARRAILPTYNPTDGNPTLVFLLTQNGGNQVIAVKGSNLAAIVGLAFTDVKVGGNSGSAPGVVSLAVSDTQIDVTLDDVGIEPSDFWGLAFTDSDGVVYIAPSPLTTFAPI